MKASQASELLQEDSRRRDLSRPLDSNSHSALPRQSTSKPYSIGSSYISLEMSVSRPDDDEHNHNDVDVISTAASVASSRPRSHSDPSGTKSPR